MLIRCLKGFFALILLTMLVATGKASLEQNMFSIPPVVTHNPWFTATLMDAYFGFLTFILWTWYRTPGIFSRIIWLVLILALGNIAMSSYMLILLYRLSASASAKDILLRPEHAAHTAHLSGA